jgi:hypothetical protein
MTDLAISPSTERAKPETGLTKSPVFGIAGMLEAILRHYGDALKMAYFDPYQPSQRQKDPRI